MQTKIIIETQPIDYKIEHYVVQKLNKNPPESYDKIKSNELCSIYSNVINKFTKKQTENFSTQIIMSIRANLMREHMILTHEKIQLKQKNIIEDYKSGFDIKQLVIKYDGSPLNLLRLIFKSKYHKKITFIINNNNVLDHNDKIQLQWAIDHDTYALINQNEILINSKEFELKIKMILDQMNIKYKTQEELAKEQLQFTNKITITPDFLIIDEFYINGHKINWIDAKNFYGSNTKFMLAKIKSQTNKYINKWGCGSIIFNLSFNSKLKINNIIMIDYISFKNFTLDNK